MFTPEDAEKMMSESREEIKAGIIKKVSEKLEWSVEHAIQDEVSKIVKEFVENEIAEELKKQLTAERATIISAAVHCAETISKELGEAMIEEARKKLKDSYHVRSIVKEIWG